MLEFAAAIVVLVIGVFLPLLDLGIIPVHWVLSQEIVANYTRRLALCQSFSQALTMLDADDSINNQLLRLGGVKPQTITCLLIISQLEPPFESFTVETAKKIPPAWLPGGGKAPCSYEIKVAAQVEFNPLVLMKIGKANIPGLTKPFSGVIEAKTPWENYGCDPATNQFFMNE